MPPDTRREYDKAFIDAAREVGGLYLADGNIQRAWPYFRAIGETAPVAAAIDKFDSQEGFEPIIEIAYMERVSPYKGFQIDPVELRHLPRDYEFRTVSQPRGPGRIVTPADAHPARGAGGKPEARHHEERRAGAGYPERSRAHGRTRLAV